MSSMLATYQQREREANGSLDTPSAIAAQPSLFLTKQTFIALTDGTLVFLDLHNDRYSCLERRHTIPVAEMLGLPISQHLSFNSQATCTREDIEQTVSDLINNGIATRDSAHGKRAEFLSQYDQLEEMLGYKPGDGPKVRVADAAFFFKALIVTQWRLKFSSMERTVTHVRRRRERNTNRAKPSLNYERINELVEIFKILKPLFVTVKDQCIYNSLLLIEFLASYRIYPNWYFGVQLNDFYAHCWVQDHNILFDDFICVVCDKQPIMTT